MTRITITALFCGLLLLFCSPSFAEVMMGYTSDTDFKLSMFKRDINYDEAIKNEKRDGLIDIDFRKLEAPPFATQWPNDAGWTFHKKEYFHFRWGVKSTHVDARIVAEVYENYEDARRWFFSRAESTTMGGFLLPWIVCSKKIGTVCAQSKNKGLTFFVYKNVIIDVSCYRCDPGHEGFTETMAEWLFDALKAAPLRPMPR
jgi:hypothetical protein